MRTIVAIALYLAVVVPGSFGAYNAYLRIEGIDGESQAEGREGWLDVFAVSHGVAHRDHAAVSLLKFLDSASPLLALDCARGTIFPEAIVDFVRADQTSVRFYRVYLKDVLISRVELQTESDAGQVREMVALDFSYIEWSYTEFDTDNAPVEEHITYWDIPSQTGGTIPGGGGDPPPPGEVEFRLRADLHLSSENLTAGVLTWRSIAGKTYEIYYAPTLGHGFDTLVATVPSAGDETTSFAVEFSGRMGFFIVKELED